MTLQVFIFLFFRDFAMLFRQKYTDFQELKFHPKAINVARDTCFQFAVFR